MKIEVKTLMDENEMLSHIFLGCIPRDKLIAIRDKFVGEVDWQKESVKIPVELKIGGVPVNPKAFFDSWKDQMQNLIKESAIELVSKKMGSERISEFQNQLYAMQEVLKTWEQEINWEASNPFIES